MTWKTDIFRSNPKLNTSLNFDTLEEAQEYGRKYDENVVIVENTKTGQWAKKERNSTEFCPLAWPRGGNTKARSEIIFNTAASVLEAAGGCIWFDRLPAGEIGQPVPPARWLALEQMYAAVCEQTGCVRETAKRNVAKALRRARYGEIVKRGGPGRGQGAPPGNRNAAKKPQASE